MLSNESTALMVRDDSATWGSKPPRCLSISAERARRSSDCFCSVMSVFVPIQKEIATVGSFDGKNHVERLASRDEFIHRASTFGNSLGWWTSCQP